MNAVPDEVNNLIEQGRSPRLDWLGEQASVEAIAAILTALANTSGGDFILGITGPTATVTGVRDVEHALDKVIQAALIVEPPLIMPLPSPVSLQGRTVVVAHIPPGMPHIYGFDGRFLCRQGTDNVPLKPRDLRRLMLERGEVSYENELARGAGLEDINWDAAQAYVSSLGGLAESNVENILLQRGCLARQEGRLRPTNAGILLFGKDPQRFVRGAEITAARFPGDAMSDKFEKLDIRGTLPEQIRRAEIFLRDNLVRGVALGKTMARSETFEYPLEAARELVVNAVAHRDYSVIGDGIRLFLYRDRMEVMSPGGLPGPVTIANIKEERFSRNPVIVQVLSDMNFIERLGYGVDRVYALMQEKRMRAPDFHETAGGLRVTLFNEVSDEPAPAIPVASAFQGVFRGVPVNPRQEAALAFLHGASSRITNSDLQSLCPDVHSETIRRDLADLVSKNILRKLGQKRGSYYVLVAE